jgi:hypothetical protein
MRIPENTIKAIEEALKLRSNGDYEVRIYTLVCALEQNRTTQLQQVEELKELLKACLAQIMRDRDILNEITSEGNELSLRVMDYLIK